MTKKSKETILKLYNEQITEAVRELPISHSNSPVNPPKNPEDIIYDKNNLEIVAAHDPRRIAAEQKIIACLNLSVITASTKVNKENLSQVSIDFAKETLTRRCAAELFNKDETPLQRLNSKIDLLPLPQDIKEVFREALVENDLAKFENSIKSFRGVKNAVPGIPNIISRHRVDGKNIQDVLMDKFYQISDNIEKEGPLRSQSHDRQYDENRKLDNITAVFNKYSQEPAAQLELLKKEFAGLRDSGMYKDKTTIIIEYDGVEKGVLTADIAKAALEAFKDKKVILIGTDRQKEFTEGAANNIMNDETLKKAIDEGKFEYHGITPVNSEKKSGVGQDSAPIKEILEIGKVDLFITAHTYNFHGGDIVKQQTHHADINAVAILIHGSEDFQAEVREATNGACRNPGNQHARINKQMAGAEKQTFEGETVKAAMRGLEPFSEKDIERILALRNGDFSNKLFMEKGEEKKLDMLLILEKELGSPIVNFEKEERKGAIDKQNYHVTGKIPLLNSGCTLVQVNKEMAPELWEMHKNIFAEANKSINQYTAGLDEGGHSWGDRVKG